MGALIWYFETLSHLAPIDKDIVEGVSLNNLVAQPDTSTPSTNDWKSSHRVVKYAGINNFCTFIPWIGGKICTAQIPTGHDIISTKFSGCYMAKFSDLHGKNFGAHIHTDSNIANDKRCAWNNYMRGRGQIQCTLFRPSLNMVAWVGGDEAWAIISNRNECYTVVVSHTPPPGESRYYDGTNTGKVFFLKMYKNVPLASVIIP